MITTRILSACTTMVLSGAMALGQTDNRTPAEKYGPVHPSNPVTPSTSSTGSSRAPIPVTNVYWRIYVPPKLAEKLKPMLPQGQDPQAAASGFGGLMGFVTTVRAANNLNVPFGDLKQKITAGSPKEIQKAIHALKPEVDAKAELRKATEQAKQDVKEVTVQVRSGSPSRKATP